MSQSAGNGTPYVDILHILSVSLEGARQLDRSEHRCAAFARLRQAQNMVAQLTSGGQPGQSRDHDQIAEDDLCLLEHMEGTVS
jgi:hypothetical protein